MRDALRIDLRERFGKPGGLDTPRASFFPAHADWMCSMCRIGEHDGCMGETKVCFCPICWGNEDDNQTEDLARSAQHRALDGNLTSSPLLW